MSEAWSIFMDLTVIDRFLFKIGKYFMGVMMASTLMRFL